MLYEKGGLRAYSQEEICVMCSQVMGDIKILLLTWRM